MLVSIYDQCPVTSEKLGDVSQMLNKWFVIVSTAQSNFQAWYGMWASSISICLSIHHSIAGEHVLIWQVILRIYWKVKQYCNNVIYNMYHNWHKHFLLQKRGDITLNFLVSGYFMLRVRIVGISECVVAPWVPSVTCYMLRANCYNAER